MHEWQQADNRCEALWSLKGRLAPSVGDGLYTAPRRLQCVRWENIWKLFCEVSGKSRDWGNESLALCYGSFNDVAAILPTRRHHTLLPRSFCAPLVFAWAGAAGHQAAAACQHGGSRCPLPFAVLLVVRLLSASLLGGPPRHATPRHPCCSPCPSWDHGASLPGCDHRGASLSFGAAIRRSLLLRAHPETPRLFPWLGRESRSSRRVVGPWDMDVMPSFASPPGCCTFSSRRGGGGMGGSSDENLQRAQAAATAPPPPGARPSLAGRRKGLEILV